MSAINQRLDSIDIFRALTMVLMIFVNDFWSLTNIPHWLKHTAAEVDGMGLSDWVFPGFLFIVGLSIPFAMASRRAKGAAAPQIFLHILFRSFALWVMGLMMVNLEMTSDAVLPIPKAIWQLFMIVGFFLVWNRYPGPRWGKVPVWTLQAIGVVLLVGLAVLYRGGSPAEPIWMRTHWWGILGLIGWGYFLCAILYLLIGRSMKGLTLALIVLFALNAIECLPVAVQPRIVVGAANHASVMLGVWVAALLITNTEKGNVRKKWIRDILILATILAVYGFATRPLWGISKIYGTPSWVALCGSISALAFLTLYWICDVMKATRWARLIAPAGRNTLTCYLVPYVVYALMMLVDFRFPAALSSGAVGLLKSLLFALAIVQLTRVLEGLKIRVRI